MTVFHFPPSTVSVNSVGQLKDFGNCFGMVNDLQRERSTINAIILNSRGLTSQCVELALLNASLDCLHG